MIGHSPARCVGYTIGDSIMSSDMGCYRRCFQPRQWFNGDGEPDPFLVVEEESLMWVYIQEGEGTYVVGFYSPDGAWHPEGKYDTPAKAAARVNYLNGGAGPPSAPSAEKVEQSRESGPAPVKHESHPAHAEKHETTKPVNVGRGK